MWLAEPVGLEDVLRVAIFSHIRNSETPLILCGNGRCVLIALSLGLLLVVEGRIPQKLAIRVVAGSVLVSDAEEADLVIERIDGLAHLSFDEEELKSLPTDMQGIAMKVMAGEGDAVVVARGLAFLLCGREAYVAPLEGAEVPEGGGFLYVDRSTGSWEVSDKLMLRADVAVVPLVRAERLSAVSVTRGLATLLWENI